MTGTIIETERLRLAPLAQDEMEDLHLLWTRPEVRRWLWDDQVIPPEQTDEVVAESGRLFGERGFGLWGVRDPASDALLGFGGFWHFRDPPELELVLGLAPEHQGRGLATEAGRALIGHAFATLGFAEVRGSTDAPNAPSVRLMERLGMAFERRETVAGLDTVFYHVLRG